MSFEMFKLIDEPDYVPYCGPCPSPIVRVVRDPSDMFDTCPRCKNNVYLNSIRMSKGDVFYNAHGDEIPTPKYWLLDNDHDAWFDHSEATKGSVLLNLREGAVTRPILILPRLIARD